jgi:hypothetical protein
MVQLKVLSGKMAGTLVVARRFPFQIGRAAQADLTLEEPGVWDEHLEIQFEPDSGFVVAPHGDALITVNGEPARRSRLRNGDRIEMGAAGLQFWLGETTQRGLRVREWLAWVIITLITGVQLYLIAQLL